MRLAKPRRLVPRYAFYVPAEVWTWGGFWGKGYGAKGGFAKSGDGLGPALIIVDALVYVFLLVQLVRSVRARQTLARLLAEALVSVSLFVGDFGWIYWVNGNGHNFSQRLTRLDAIYFSAGTLTTAGTGNISAVSESAKFTQLLQMIVAVALVAVGLAAVVTVIAMPGGASREHALPSPRLKSPARKRKRKHRS